MNGKPEKVILPLGKEDFRRALFKLLGLQFLFVLIAFSGKTFFVDKNLSFYFFYAFLGFATIASVFTHDFSKYQSRFKDVFPDSDLSINHLLLLSFLPVAFVGFIIYLMFKDRGETRFPLKYLKFKFLALPIIIIVFLQLYFPTFAYYTAMPAIYAPVRIAHNGIDAADYANKLKSSERVLQEYQTLYAAKYTFLQKYLLLEAMTKIITKERDLSIARGMTKEEATVSHGIRVLEVISDILESNKKTESRFFDFSIISWLSFSGVIEITALYFVEDYMSQRFDEGLHVKTTEILSKLQKLNLKRPSVKQTEYSIKLSEISKRIEATELRNH